MNHQVLLAVPDDLLAADIRDLLDEGGGFTVCGLVDNTLDLGAAVREREPDVVLLHEAIGPAPAFATLRDLVARGPALAVVLIVREASTDVLSVALEAGARGVLTLPLAYGEVRSRLSAAADWSRRLRDPLDDNGEPVGGIGQVVVVAGSKGGVGASTVAARLALLGAGSPGRRVCLVDLDLQTGDLPAVLDLAHERGIADLVEVTDEMTRRHLDDVLFTHASGMRVLLAPESGERAGDVTAAVARRSLALLRSMVDVVVVDVGSVLSEASAGAIEMADRVLLVATPDMLSLRAAQRTGQLWERLQIRKAEDVVVVLNRASRRVMVQPGLAARVVGSPVSPITVPASFKTLEEAVNTGGGDDVLTGPVPAALRSLARSVGVLPGASGRRQFGGATLELAGVFPFVLLLGLLVVQGLLGAVTVLMASAVVGDAGRAAEAGQSDVRIVAGVRGELPGPWRQGVRARRAPGELTVTLQVPSVLPGAPLDWTVSSRTAVLGRAA